MNATQPEEWRAIPGWEGYYEVSSLGGIRSLDRVITDRNGHRRYFSGRMLNPSWNQEKSRYIVGLCRGGRPHMQPVHVLVALAFHGPRPPGLYACHNNDDTLNNRADNIRWDTPSANVFDSVRNKSHGWSSRTHCKHGHEFTPENTRWVPSRKTAAGRTQRLCRKCRKARETQRRAKKRLTSAR